jgi:hypothetical protein
MIRKPPTVRLAVPADIEPLFWLLMRDLANDNPMGRPVSPTKILTLVKLCCNGNGGVAGVIEERGSIVGSAGITLAQHDLSDANFLKQVWLFVVPSIRKRHPDYAEKLFKFCLWHKGDMSQRLGYDVPLEISVMSRKRLPAKLRMWSRYGDMIGAVFWARDTDEHRQQVDNHPIDPAPARSASGL